MNELLPSLQSRRLAKLLTIYYHVSTQTIQYEQNPQYELASRILARLAVIELECVKLYKATDKLPALPPPPKLAAFDIWTQLIVESGHSWVWTGRRLLCRVCQNHRGPAAASKWIRQGKCPGAPKHRRASFLKEKGLRRCYAPQISRWLDTIGQALAHLETTPLIQEQNHPRMGKSHSWDLSSQSTLGP